MSKTRAFCFTLNNYTSLDEVELSNLECKYLVYGREKAPETGTPHLQGYVYFENPRSLKSILKLFKWHVEPARGDADQNFTYCAKGGDTFEKGIRPMSQKRKGEAEQERWTKIIKSAELGTIRDTDPKIYFEHFKTCELLRTKYQQGIPMEPCALPGEFYIGPSGSGKSRGAREDYPGAYIKNCNKWWDGYMGQEAVIMDDLDPGLAKALSHHLKIWLDHYPFTAEIKGGSIFIRPKKIIITTQYPLDRLFEEPEVLEAIRRRCRILEFDPVVPDPSAVLTDKPE